MKKIIKSYQFLIIAVFICGSLSGCKLPELYSDWRDRDIVIDGKYSDWPDTQTYYIEKENVIINLTNNKEYLYLCLITMNRELEIKIMESGFVVWFDQDGGMKRVFGIAFPVGLKNMGMSLNEEKRSMESDWEDQQDIGGLIDRDKERQRSKEFTKHLETMEGLQDKLGLMIGSFDMKGKRKKHRPDLDKKEIAPKDRPKVLTLDETALFGIEAKVGRQNNYFVYELKVPLVKTPAHPYAIGAKPGQPISMGLEVGAARGMNIMGGGEHQMRRGGQDEMSTDEGYPMRSDSNFKFWGTVMLAPDAPAN